MENNHQSKDLNSFHATCLILYLLKTSENRGFLMFSGLYERKYSRMDLIKFFEGCLPQIIFGPFLNNLFHIKKLVA